MSSFDRRTLLTGLAGLGLLPQGAFAQAAPSRTPDVVYVPTPDAVVERMLELCKPTKTDMLYDLGSGDGRIPITAARKYGTRGIGIDIDPQRIREANANAIAQKVTNLVTFKQADLFTSNFSDGSIITLYLLPSLNVKLRPQLYRQLKPGTRIVSHAFDMGDWEADHNEAVGGNEIYFWMLPANMAGTWQVKTTTGTSRWTVRQTYQKLTILSDGKGQVSEPRLSGDQFSASLREPDGKVRALTGTVRGGSISGQGWTASKIA
jgi:SAM-dependent methyltransferase